MNEHYMCTGDCGGVSDKPGTCQASDCSHHGEPLEKCDCDDAAHQGKEGDGADSGNE